MERSDCVLRSREIGCNITQCSKGGLFSKRIIE